jgi:lactam utilization protein B
MGFMAMGGVLSKQGWRAMQRLQLMPFWQQHLKPHGAMRRRSGGDAQAARRVGQAIETL